MSCCEAVKAFEEMLNKLYPVRVGQLKYDAAEVLKQVDPTAYRTALNDYLDAEGVEYDCEPDDC